MSYYVHTNDLRRRALWLRLFGVERLPVLAPHPRCRVERGARGETEIQAYDLDGARLHWMAQRRAMRRLNVSAAQLTGLAIEAGADIEVEVETAVSSDRWKRPFLFGRMMYVTGRITAV